jgi:acyl carrier protein
MEIIDFIKNFAEQFENTAISAITAHTRFRDLEEWSSLTALSVIAMVDEQYNVRLKGDDIRNAQTVGELYEAVNKSKK